MNIFRVCFLFVLLFSINSCSSSGVYGGSEMIHLLSQISKKWDLDVLGTGESCPEMYLDGVTLFFKSCKKLTPNEARNLIVDVAKDALFLLNQCENQKKRSRNGFFTADNIRISISFADRFYKSYESCYASGAILNKKGLWIDVDDEWGHSDEVIVEDVPAELRNWQPNCECSDSCIP